MARKQKVETVDQDAELEQAQTEVADYGREGTVDSLIKAVHEATDDLSKAGKGKFPPAAADDDDEEEDGSGGGDDDEDEDGGGDEDEEDDGGDDDEDEDAAPPPAKGKKPNPFKRSRAGEDAAEEFLKSVLLDDDGQPTAEAEVIEVSDVLTHLTDVFAKSIGALGEEIGALQLQLDEALPLLKAMGHHQIQTGQIVKSTRNELARLRKSGAGGHAPNPGVAFSMRKSMPGAEQKKPNGALTKSQAAAGLMAAYQTQAISAELYQRLAPAIDTQGVEAVLGQLPDGMADQIREAAGVLAS